MMYAGLLVTVFFCYGALARHAPNVEKYTKDADMHKFFTENHGSTRKAPQEEAESSFWNDRAQNRLKEKIRQQLNTNVAKNVIMFLGDGMSVPTLAASRIYQGQQNGDNGEEGALSFDLFPFAGFSRTYCVDSQVADSACTATAYLGGVKANIGTIGVNAKVPRYDCEASVDPSTYVYSIGRWSQLAGKKTGLATTTTVTHASPAGVYAHVANRDWESDGDASSIDTTICPDIAHQLVYGETGKNLNVVLGGGRTKFIGKNDVDPYGNKGERRDNENLIETWLQQKEEAQEQAKYVYDRDGLLEVNGDTDYLLGLFSTGHMAYHLDADEKQAPTLEEMTEAAIKVLSKAEEGYFLFVEGGLIDHAHHATYGQKAFDETIEFSKAIQKALNMTNASETLIVVTSDHAHTMSFSGYPSRGNDILGVAGKGSDGLSYATISYANGPGYRKEEDGHRYDLDTGDMGDKDFKFPATAPLGSETHGGDDVGIFATGPWAHFFTGSNEQNLIPHMMAFASCVGDGITACDLNGN